MAEDFFGNLSKTLKKTVDTVGKKTDEFVEIQKIRTRQHALEDQIEKNYQDIGQIIYNRYLNGEAFDENLAGICKRYHRSGKKRLQTAGKTWQTREAASYARPAAQVFRKMQLSACAAVLLCRRRKMSRRMPSLYT